MQSLLPVYNKISSQGISTPNIEEKRKQAPPDLENFAPCYMQILGKTDVNDHSIILKHSSTGITIVIIYEDVICITCKDSIGIRNLQSSFQTRDSRTKLNFLGRKVQTSAQGIVVLES